MGLNLKIEGLFVAQISQALRISVAETYEYPKERKVIEVRGVVVGPSTHGLDTQITKDTREVRLANVTRIETIDGTAKVIPTAANTTWAVHTDSVILRIWGH